MLLKERGHNQQNTEVQPANMFHKVRKNKKNPSYQLQVHSNILLLNAIHSQLSKYKKMTENLGHCSRQKMQI